MSDPGPNPAEPHEFPQEERPLDDVEEKVVEGADVGIGDADINVGGASGAGMDVDGTNIDVGGAEAEEEPTVISSGPPLLLPQLQHGLLPHELGQRLEGERLGHFELQQFIGGGGMGAVFRALDTMLNRIVAVKVLSNEQASDEETRRRFKNEAQSAARLDHENIARVYYVGEDRGVHYIVFEHIEGVNIRDLVIRRGPLPLPEAISYMLQVCKALEHASKRDVVHRDVKPSNILVTADGRAKLVDMGLARLHQVEHTENDLTASGVTLGTFDYISPEQAREPRKVDVRSDLYSLGCTMYFMLTGRPPFPEGTVLQKLLQHHSDDAPDPRDLRSDLPSEIGWLTSKLLAKSPDDRFQRPKDVIREAVAICERLGLSIAEAELVGSNSGDQDSSAVRPSRRSRLVRSIPYAVPVALLFSIVAVDLFDSQDQQALLGDQQPINPSVRTEDAADDSASEQPETPAAVNTAGENRETMLADDPDVPPAGKNASTASDTATAVPDELETPPDKTLPDKTRPDKTLPEKRDPPLEQGVAALDRGAGVGQPDASAGVSLEGDSAAATAVDVSRRQAVDLPGAAEPAGTGDGVPPGPKSPRENTRIVKPGDAAAYQTLGAALQDAENGEAIELHTSESLVSERIKLEGRTLTIRGAAGFFPRIVFQPGPDEKLPALYPRSMVALTNADLTLLNVELAMDLTSAARSNRWVLVEARGATALTCDDCVLTVRRADAQRSGYPEGGAVIEVTTPVDSEAASMTGSEESEAADASEPTKIRLRNCIARGEAVLLRSADMQPVHLAWDNGLAALSEHFLVEQSAQVANRDQVEAVIDLQHVTTYTAGGFLLVQNRDGYPVRTQVRSVDSILACGADAALVEQRGVNSVTALQSLLTWEAERTFYEGFRTFWRIDVEDDLSPAETFDGAQWQEYWQARSPDSQLQTHQGAVIWQRLPDRQKPLHAVTPADFALSQGARDNKALAAAKDGRDVGFIIERLPVPHVVEEAAPSTPASPAAEAPAEDEGPAERPADMKRMTTSSDLNRAAEQESSGTPPGSAD